MAQSIVVQDTVFYPKAMRKHVEIGIFGIIRGIGVGITTYKNKHSWAYTLNAGKRSYKTKLLPLNEVVLGSIQAEYRHRINTKRAPVFWHLDFGLNYLRYKQKSNLYTTPIILNGSKFYPNFGIGTGYFLAMSDKRNVEIIGSVNYQFVNSKVTEPINGVFTAYGRVLVNGGLAPILKFRYSF